MAEQTLKPGWTRVSFGDVVKLNTDRCADPAAAGIERYVGLEHIEPEDLRIRRWGAVADGTTFTNRFQPGQVLFGKRRAYQRKVAVAEFEGVCSSDIYVFEPKDARLLPELLPFLCQTEAFYAHAVGTSAGSLSPRTNWTQLATYEFALPPLEEQRRICAILAAIEDAITACKSARDSASTVMYSLSYEEFNLDEDEGMDSLSSYYTITSGQVDPKDNAYSSLPLIAPNHIESGTGIITHLESAEAQGAISGKYYFEEGTVLYSKIRPNLVKAAIAPCRGLCSADMYPLLPNPLIRKEYLLEILLSARFTQYAVSGSTRTGIPKLNRDHLIGYKCVVPTMPEQDRYLQVAYTARSATARLADRIDSLQKLKAVVLGEMFG